MWGKGGVWLGDTAGRGLCRLAFRRAAPSARLGHAPAPPPRRRAAAHGHSVEDLSWVTEKKKTRARKDSLWKYVSAHLPHRIVKSVWAAGQRMFYPVERRVRVCGGGGEGGGSVCTCVVGVLVMYEKHCMPV